MAWIKSFLHWGKVLFCAPKENQKSARYFRGAGSDGLRYPASTSCLGRHSCPADRGPNSSSLFPPQAAVVAVARKGLLAPFRPRRGSRNGKKLAASLRRVAAPSVCFAAARILLAAVPTASPCFRHWRRSSLLRFFLASPICCFAADFLDAAIEKAPARMRQELFAAKIREIRPSRRRFWSRWRRTR